MHVLSAGISWKRSRRWKRPIWYTMSDSETNWEKIHEAMQLLARSCSVACMNI